jgi:hypothetical protein
MRNISTVVRGHYDDDRYMWAIIIRRLCDRNISKDLAMDRSAWRLAINVPEP